MREALRWVERVAGPVAGVERLRGSSSSAVHALELEDGRGLVLRRFVDEDWLAREPDLAEREARVLELLARSDVPAPRLVAVEPERHWVLMTRLPGEIDLAPRDLDSRLAQLAEPLEAIHAVAGKVPRYRTYEDVQALEPPPWTAHREAWEDALETVRGPAPPTTHCFIHRDYQPSNALWSGGRLTGIVDWVNASWGPPGIDVGHCRLNLALLFDPETAARFGPEQNPYWDLLSAIEFLPDGGRGAIAMWQEAGRTDLTPELVVSRYDEYVAGIAARL